ncbi:MAG: cupin domain-containing protein [Prolixibacteraceae bacterium]
MKKLLVFSLINLLALATFAQLQEVKPDAYRWAGRNLKISPDRESGVFLEGISPHLDYVKIHATTQFPGTKPSPEHANKDMEELIIVKEGTMKATVDGQSRILGAGSVVLIMPQQRQSLENIGTGNLSYFAMKYKSKKPVNIKRGIASGGSMMLNADSLTFKKTEKGGGRAYFDRATAMCERLEMHVTQLNKKGPSHNPHSHIETEIILVISGQTEMTIDGTEHTAGPGDFYFINSGLFHGVRNASDEPCSYFAFKWN